MLIIPTLCSAKGFTQRRCWRFKASGMSNHANTNSYRHFGAACCLYF